MNSNESTCMYCESHVAGESHIIQKSILKKLESHEFYFEWPSCKDLIYRANYSIDNSYNRNKTNIIENLFCTKPGSNNCDSNRFNFHENELIKTEEVAETLTSNINCIEQNYRILCYLEKIFSPNNNKTREGLVLSIIEKSTFLEEKDCDLYYNIIKEKRINYSKEIEARHLMSLSRRDREKAFYNNDEMYRSTKRGDSILHNMKISRTFNREMIFNSNIKNPFVTLLPIKNKNKLIDLAIVINVPNTLYYNEKSMICSFLTIISDDTSFSFIKNLEDIWSNSFSMLYLLSDFFLMPKEATKEDLAIKNEIKSYLKDNNAIAEDINASFVRDLMAIQKDPFYVSQKDSHFKLEIYTNKNFTPSSNESNLFTIESIKKIERTKRSNSLTPFLCLIKELMPEDYFGARYFVEPNELHDKIFDILEYIPKNSEYEIVGKVIESDYSTYVNESTFNLVGDEFLYPSVILVKDSVPLNSELNLSYKSGSYEIKGTAIENINYFESMKIDNLFSFNSTNINNYDFDNKLIFNERNRIASEVLYFTSAYTTIDELTENNSGEFYFHLAELNNGFFIADKDKETNQMYLERSGTRIYSNSLYREKDIFGYESYDKIVKIPYYLCDWSLMRYFSPELKMNNFPLFPSADSNDEYLEKLINIVGDSLFEAKRLQDTTNRKLYKTNELDSKLREVKKLVSSEFSSLIVFDLSKERNYQILLDLDDVNTGLIYASEVPKGKELNTYLRLPFSYMKHMSDWVLSREIEYNLKVDPLDPIIFKESIWLYLNEIYRPYHPLLDEFNSCYDFLSSIKGKEKDQFDYFKRIDAGLETLLNLKESDFSDYTKISISEVNNKLSPGDLVFSPEDPSLGILSTREFSHSGQLFFGLNGHYAPISHFNISYLLKIKPNKSIITEWSGYTNKIFNEINFNTWWIQPEDIRPKFPMIDTDVDFFIY